MTALEVAGAVCAALVFCGFFAAIEALVLRLVHQGAAADAREELGDDAPDQSGIRATRSNIDRRVS